jgi:major membrane immunogen (membrane-anchored lipoprotein)
MKKFKFLVVAILICSMCFSLVACGLSQEDAIGIWSGSYEYNGNQFTQTFALADDGTYVKVTVKNGEISSSEDGTYELKGGTVVLHEDGNTGISTKYKYKGGNLVNNGHKFSKK